MPLIPFPFDKTPEEIAQMLHDSLVTFETPEAAKAFIDRLETEFKPEIYIPGPPKFSS